MIKLTRLKNSNPLYLNADHIERLDSHHETTIHMLNGAEYVVTESAEEIVRLITEQRAQLLAAASRLQHAIDVSEASISAIGVGDDSRWSPQPAGEVR